PLLAPPVAVRVRERGPPVSPTGALKKTLFPTRSTALVAKVTGPVKLKVSADAPALSPTWAAPARTTGFAKANALPPLLLFRLPPTRVSVPEPKLAPITAPLATVFTTPEFRTKLTLVGAEVADPVLRMRAPEMAGEIERARLPVPCRAVLKKLLLPVP